MASLEVNPYWLIPLAAVCIFLVQLAMKLLSTKKEPEPGQ